MRYAFTEEHGHNPVIPSRGSIWSAGLDLAAYIGIHDRMVIQPGERGVVPTGIIVEIPHGHYGRIAPRSGLAAKHGIDVLAGVIDSDYRGELKAVIQNLGDEPFEIENGDRIAQLIIEKVSLPDLEWVENFMLSDTQRGTNGWGSTGVTSG
jgi:dUTP pyrophosphatase